MTASQLLCSFLWAAAYVHTLDVDVDPMVDLSRYRVLVYLDGEWL